MARLTELSLSPAALRGRLGNAMLYAFDKLVKGGVDGFGALFKAFVTLALRSLKITLSVASQRGKVLLSDPHTRKTLLQMLAGLFATWICRDFLRGFFAGIGGMPFKPRDFGLKLARYLTGSYPMLPPGHPNVINNPDSTLVVPTVNGRKTAIMQPDTAQSTLTDPLGNRTVVNYKIISTGCG